MGCAAAIVAGAATGEAVKDGWNCQGTGSATEVQVWYTIDMEL